MIFSWLLTSSLFVAASGNIAGDYCKVLVEYETFKAQLDNYLASRDEVCDGMQIRTDCSRIKEEFPDAKDGIYRIKPEDGEESFLAFCDMESDEHGWLVFQRRKDGSVDFYKDWFTYREGFGNLTGEFWLGNEYIHRVTTQGHYSLRVDMTDGYNNSIYAEYSHFEVGNMSEFYILTVSGYSGNAGDELTYHNNSRFSTKNLDLDINSGNCAQKMKGGWWYKDCYKSNLNGLYGSKSYEGLWWSGSKQNNIKTKTTMKIKSLD